MPYTVNHHYDTNGADTLNKPTATGQGTAPLYRWMYYDGSGRMAGYKQGQWVSFPGNMAWAITGTACRYDADGQMYLPCNQAAPQLSFDGPNVIGTSTKWRFIHAPGVDEPLMARYENYAGAWLRELYFVTDGQGRQLSVGDMKGYIHQDDFSTDGSHWRYSGAARNASGFDAERLGPGAMPGVSMFRNRAYDSRTGRWTQEDPIGVAGGLNLYQFNGNDPAAYTDPFGLSPCIPPDSPKCMRERVEGPVTSTDPGLMDPTVWLAGGIAGAGRALAGRLFGRAATAAVADVTASFSASEAATAVAGATGGTVGSLATSGGYKVTVEVGRRSVVARIKANGEFRVAIDGIGALTSAGQVSSDRALTHLTARHSDEITGLMGKAIELLKATRH